MKKRILCLITSGLGGQDELRAHHLAGSLDADVTYHAVDKSMARVESSRIISRLLQSEPWDLVYQEGTGIAGGWALVRAHRARGLRYILSSGDPISGFFHVTKGPHYGAAFRVFEEMLYRSCEGFVGWTPYLTGRALDMGAPRAVTVEGGADLLQFHKVSDAERVQTRKELGLDPSHLVCGVVGSLLWNPRQSYSYGLELVETLRLLKRTDVSVLIVGDGDGRQRLEQRIPDGLKGRVVFTGRLPLPDVAKAMNAMDIGFVTQTLDCLGSFRLTTKLPEYLACSLPVAMSPIPGFYDYASPAGWPLPAHHPASKEFHRECAAWIDGLTWDDVAQKSARARDIACRRFDYSQLSERFAGFVHEIIGSSNRTQP